MEIKQKSTSRKGSLVRPKPRLRKDIEGKGLGHLIGNAGAGTAGGITRHFGQLSRDLRREHISPYTDRPMSQKELAKRTGLKPKTIEKIEQGNKVKITADIINSYADAFRISTGERQELLLAGLVAESDGLVSQEHTPEEICTGCVQYIQRAYAPALLVDQYYDIIAANAAFLELYGIKDTKDWLDASPAINFFDIMLGHIHPSSLAAGSTEEEATQEKFIIKTIIEFRTNSLRYRPQEYYRKLRHRLKRQYKSFKEVWGFLQAVVWVSEEELPEFRNDQFSDYTILFRRQGQLLSFGTSTNKSRTQQGILETIVYTPNNTETHQLFANILKYAGQEAVIASQWPNKPPY